MEHDFECFGSLVFDDRVMKATLSAEVYRKLRKTVEEGSDLELDTANAVAGAMKTWALEHGATHFTHWFQPLTGITAEKHECFISPASDGRIIPEFSGKELIRGEPDASSFPSGGLRATFEARGYTAWDPTSYAFIKGKTLCIPTAFCSYGGEALDKKTPLLRSMDAFNCQALRILRLFGNRSVRQVRTCVGAEQEYFLVDRKDYLRRRDLIYTGRTLFGAMPPKGQEMDDHYFGSIKPRVAAYMEDLNRELWKLGILAKTEHNEVAPAQHELAPIYTTTNIATDQNQLTMEIMQKVALRHDLVCLLHEKPFDGVNGSGKHNNWSMCTDTGVNLLSPGETPYENAQFLLFLCAVIKAVDDYQDLLRISVATAGNDHRLGANEAPPAVVSVFLGDELTAIMEAIAEDRPYSAAERTTLKLGVDALPRFARDNTDRNRTSPFAFTGNKFEFRMCGASQSIASPTVVLNTMVADALCQFADTLEKADDFPAALRSLLRRSFTDHQRIIFNGNGYGKEWLREAQSRGLANLRDSVDALPAYTDPKNVALFTRHGILTQAEMAARCEIHLENYCKVTAIEARTLLDMARRHILPAVSKYSDYLAQAVFHKSGCGVTAGARMEQATVRKLSLLNDKLYDLCEAIDLHLHKAPPAEGDSRTAEYYRDHVAAAVARAGEIINQMEALTDAAFWPYPTYAEILFSV